MKKLFALIIIGILTIMCTACTNNKQTDFAYYDSNTEEFYILDIPVSKGAGYFINEILNDSSWELTTVEIPEEGWRYSPFDDFKIPHYVTFNRNINSEDSTIVPNFLFIEWYQSGQIEHISVRYSGCKPLDDHCEYYLKRFHTWDSIFPDKKIANSRCGYFEFFGIKNIKVYCTPNMEQYSFDEITNEKYEVNIRDIENRLKELTPEFDTAIVEEEVDEIFLKILKETVK